MKSSKEVVPHPESGRPVSPGMSFLSRLSPFRNADADSRNLAHVVGYDLCKGMPENTPERLRPWEEQNTGTLQARMQGNIGSNADRRWEYSLVLRPFGVLSMLPS